MIFAQRRGGGTAHFRRAHDKKVNILAMAALLAVPDAALPTGIAAGLSQLMAGAVQLLLALKHQQVYRALDLS